MLTRPPPGTTTSSTSEPLLWVRSSRAKVFTWPFPPLPVDLWDEARWLQGTGRDLLLMFTSTVSHLSSLSTVSRTLEFKLAPSSMSLSRVFHTVFILHLPDVSLTLCTSCRRLILFLPLPPALSSLALLQLHRLRAGQLPTTQLPGNGEQDYALPTD